MSSSFFINILVMFITMICVFYLALKYRYFKDNKAKIRKDAKRRIINIVDVSLVVSILIFCVMHVNNYLNGINHGETRKSYLIYILAMSAIYLIWANVNVKLYRKKGTAEGKISKKNKNK